MKKLLSLLFIYLILSVEALAASGPAIRIYDVALSENSKGEYQVLIPRLRGFENKDFERQLNDSIETRAQEQLRDFAREAGPDDRLDIGYEIKRNGGLISLALNMKQSLGEARDQEIYYLNLNRDQEAYLELEDLIIPGVDLGQALGINLDASWDFYLGSKGDLVLREKKGGREQVFKQEELKDLLVEEALVGLVYLDRKIETDLGPDVSIVLPQLRGLDKKDFQASLNRTIEEEARADWEKFQEKLGEARPKDLEYRVSYEAGGFHNILSLELVSSFYIDGENYGSQKTYYNVDLDQMKLLSLGDLFKDQAYLKLMNQTILKKIEANSSSYFMDGRKFKSLGQDQDFYVDPYGNIVLVFQENTIAGQARLLPEFRISSYLLRDYFKPAYQDLGLRDPKKFILNGRVDYFKDYMNISDNGNILIPLDQLAKEFGYSLNYGQDGKFIKLERGGQTFSLRLGDNQYARGEALLILEDQSRHINGLIYVPLGFIDRILGGKSSIVNGLVNIELN